MQRVKKVEWKGRPRSRQLQISDSKKIRPSIDKNQELSI